MMTTRRRFDVSTYDSSDDPRRVGTWRRRYARVRPETLPRVLAKLYALNYCSLSIDILDQDDERLDEDEWPEPED